MKVIKRHVPSFWGPDFFDDFMIKDLVGDFEPPVRMANIKTNIVEEETSYSIELVAPGFDKDAFKVALEENQLKISAEFKNESENKEAKYTRKEFVNRSFEKTFTLPEDVKIDDIDAEYNAGILYVSLPKNMEEKARLMRSIEVK